MRRGLFVILLALGAASCKKRQDPKPAPPLESARGPLPPSVALSIAERSEKAPLITSLGASSGAPSGSSSAPGSSSPKGLALRAPRPLVERTEACTLIKGPIQLAFTGAATIVPKERAGPQDDPIILFNRDGIAARVTLPPSPPSSKEAKGKKGSKPERLALTEAAERATAPGCVFAGGYTFCVAKSGAIHRAALFGEEDKEIATSRPGSPIAATTIGDRHTVLAFLADRRTTEGATTLAFAAFDEATPTLLSEDGSGATFVTLAPRGDHVVAMYVDARRALTPLHARTLRLGPGRLMLGTDAVIFVGEGTGGRMVGDVAIAPSGPTFGLLPTTKDSTSFGLAAVRIDESPRDDAQVTWSTYPSGLDRPQVVATKGAIPVRVALVKPVSNEKGAKKVLELGEIDASGAYQALCPVAESTAFADLGLTADSFGTLWLVYTDSAGTWIERRGKL